MMETLLLRLLSGNFNIFNSVQFRPIKDLDWNVRQLSGYLASNSSNDHQGASAIQNTESHFNIMKSLLIDNQIRIKMK